MTGVLVLDKPEGFTSFDAVAVLRGLTGERKIGHTGTLDPMATGVLPMLLGRATRALPFLAERPKTYEAAFAFGVETDTLDRTGTVLHQDATKVPQHFLLSVLPQFTGEILQVPPMYSAIRQHGKRLYELAREGKTVERTPRPVQIFSLQLLQYDEEARTGRLRVVCSAGTYIRTLCADLGRACGSCGVMTALRRTQAAGFTLEDAVSLARARELPRQELLRLVLPVEQLFFHLPVVEVTAGQARRFCNGGALARERLHLPTDYCAGACRVRDDEGRFLGLGALLPEKEELSVMRLFGQGGTGT